jgi:hypothetical protein
VNSKLSNSMKIENIQLDLSMTKHYKSTKDCKNQSPPYFPNGDTLKKCFHTITITTLENGANHFQIPK